MAAVASEKTAPAAAESGRTRNAKDLPEVPSMDELRQIMSDVEAGDGQAAPLPVVDRTLHPSGIIPTLQNIVSTVNLGVVLDLKKITLKARNAEYNPKRFPAVIMRIREPKTTALVFGSGKMVVTGAKSEYFSKLAARKFARIIQNLGFPNAKFTDFRIQNIVGSTDVKFPVRLEGLASEHEDFSSYEPELFPGLIYRMVQPSCVLLVFVSGKIVITRAKTRQQIYDAFEAIYPVLVQYRKDDPLLAVAAAAAATAAAAVTSGGGTAGPTHPQGRP